MGYKIEDGLLDLSSFLWLGYAETSVYVYTELGMILEEPFTP